MESHAQHAEWPPGTEEEVFLWLNARADGECSPAQEGWLAEYVRKSPAAAREWAALEKTRLALEAAQLREPSDFEREALQKALAPALLSVWGWILLLGGLGVLAGYGAWQFLTADTIPLIARIGILAAGIGLLMLVVRLGWERLRLARIDPYREVKR